MIKLNHPNCQAIENIVFDLDGVMVEPWGFAKLLDSKYGITKEHTKEFFTEVFPDCLKNKLDLKEALAPYLMRWGWSGTVNEFVHQWLISEDLTNEKMANLVHQLKNSGYNCYLGTNQEKYRKDFISKNMGYEELFDRLFFSCELGYMKPETEFFKMIQESINCKPESIIFFDDQNSYVTAAIASGWNASLFKDFETLIDEWFVVSE